MVCVRVCVYIFVYWDGKYANFVNLDIFVVLDYVGNSFLEILYYSCSAFLGISSSFLFLKPQLFLPLAHYHAPPGYVPLIVLIVVFPIAQVNAL